MSQPIFTRAPLHMRYSKEFYFEPKFVSIGPLYNEKLKKWKAMEKAKNECVLYFVSKLWTSTNININKLIELINVAEVKDRIQLWYGKSLIRPEKSFEMLVRDSCFIIRIILAFSRDVEESMFYPGVDIKTVRFDLLLLENQIPFFFLKKVYKFLRENNTIPAVTPSEHSPSNSNSQEIDLIQSSQQGQNCGFCIPISKQSHISQSIVEQSESHEPKSPLSLDQNLSHGPQSTLSQEQSQTQRPQSTLSQEQSRAPQSSPAQTTIFSDDEFIKELKPFIWFDMPWQFDQDAKFTEEPIHLLDLYWKWCKPSPSNGQVINATNQLHDVRVHETWVETHRRRNIAPKRINSAFVLEQSAGVTFQKREHIDGFGITFQNGILQIPHLQLDPNQATLLANLVAFEEFKPSKNRFLTSYVLLLDGLINTEKDVELLEQHGVITNKLTSTQMASAYFNDIGNVCSVDYEDHYCKNQFHALNSYYLSNWNHQFAKLRHKYFNSPWAFISFFAGVLLLSLAAIQTAYSIAGYYKLH